MLLSLSLLLTPHRRSQTQPDQRVNSPWPCLCSSVPSAWCNALRRPTRCELDSPSQDGVHRRRALSFSFTCAPRSCTVLENSDLCRPGPPICFNTTASASITPTEKSKLFLISPVPRHFTHQHLFRHNAITHQFAGEGRGILGVGCLSLSPGFPFSGHGSLCLSLHRSRTPPP